MFQRHSYKNGYMSGSSISRAPNKSSRSFRYFKLSLPHQLSGACVNRAVKRSSHALGQMLHEKKAQRRKGLWTNILCYALEKRSMKLHRFRSFLNTNDAELSHAQRQTKERQMNDVPCKLTRSITHFEHRRPSSLRPRHWIVREQRSIGCH